MTDARDQQAVRAYFAAHREALIKQYGGHGAGVGRSQADPQAYSIVLYVTQVPEGASRHLEVDGIPLDFVVTDRFRPLDPPKQE
jgi:hypothetical protein